MGKTVDPPTNNPGDGTPGTPGYTPPTSSGTKIAVVTTNSAYTFTEQQIRAAGGPWPSFTIKVTPVNDNGSGTPQQVSTTADPNKGDVINGGTA